MKITQFACLLVCACTMAFASDASNKPADKAAPAEPSTIEGGNGVTLPPPPPTEAKPVTETIHGTTITDPYRWLEDGQSPATREWIAAQMKYTEDYLSQVKIRPEIVKRLDELMRVETYSIPFEADGRYFFTKRLADENQASIYVRKGLSGADERLIDATKLSADQNTNVSIADVSKDGSLLLYAVREGGADEESVHVLDVNSGKEAPDVLPRARYLGISLTPNKPGNLLLEVRRQAYGRVPAPDGNRRFSRSAHLRRVLQRRELRGAGADHLQREREWALPADRRQPRCAAEAG